MRAIALALLLSLPAFVGCGNPTTATTPTPPTTPAAIDQKIATGLSDAAAIIQGLAPLLGKYPGLKDPLNQAIALYTTTKAAALVYHTAVIGGSNPDPTQLQNQVAQLLTSVTGLQGLYK